MQYSHWMHSVQCVSRGVKELSSNGNSTGASDPASLNSSATAIEPQAGFVHLPMPFLLVRPQEIHSQCADASLDFSSEYFRSMFVLHIQQYICLTFHGCGITKYLQ